MSTASELASKEDIKQNKANLNQGQVTPGLVGINQNQEATRLNSLRQDNIKLNGLNQEEFNKQLSIAVTGLRDDLGALKAYIIKLQVAPGGFTIESKGLLEQIKTRFTDLETKLGTFNTLFSSPAPFA